MEKSGTWAEKNKRQAKVQLRLRRSSNVGRCTFVSPMPLPSASDLSQKQRTLTEPEFANQRVRGTESSTDSPGFRLVPARSIPISYRLHAGRAGGCFFGLFQCAMCKCTYTVLAGELELQLELQFGAREDRTECAQSALLREG